MIIYVEALLEEDIVNTLGKAIVMGIIVLVTACIPACSLRVSMRAVIVVAHRL